MNSRRKTPEGAEPLPAQHCGTSPQWHLSSATSRHGRTGDIGTRRVENGVTLYAGTLCFESAAGEATDVKVDASTVVLGMVRDTTSGPNVEYWTDGEFVLPVDGFTNADVGSPVHAVDNYTLTSDATSNPQAGVLTRAMPDGLGVVSIRGTR